VPHCTARSAFCYRVLRKDFLDPLERLLCRGLRCRLVLNDVGAGHAALGSAAATITATWSDGSPFTGTLTFGSPYSNDNATFAISGNNLIINPAGPGVSADANTVQNVTIVATQ